MKKFDPGKLIFLGLLFFWALSGSKFAVLVFIITLVYYLLTNFSNIHLAKLLNRKPMADVFEVKNPLSGPIKSVKKLFGGIILVIVIIWLLAASIVIVEAGYTGVYSLFGKVRDVELSSGFHLINPLARVIQMSIRTEEYTMSIVNTEGKKAGNDSIAALTKEGLSVDLDITVLYHLDENKASDVYKNVGLTYEEKVIRPAVRSTIREVIAQYDAKDIYSDKRQEAAQKIFNTMSAKMSERGIVMEDVLLRNVQLPDLLANAIQEKLTAEQEAQKYDFILDREKKEKERKIIEAEGQRDAQAIINESLTTNYLYYLYVNQLKDREGTIYVPTSPTTGLPLFRNIGN